MASSADSDSKEPSRRFVDDRGDLVYHVVLRREDVSTSSSNEGALVYRTVAEPKLIGASIGAWLEECLVVQSKKLFDVFFLTYRAELGAVELAQRLVGFYGNPVARVQALRWMAAVTGSSWTAADTPDAYITAPQRLAALANAMLPGSVDVSANPVCCAPHGVVQDMCHTQYSTGPFGAVAKCPRHTWHGAPVVQEACLAGFVRAAGRLGVRGAAVDTAAGAYAAVHALGHVADQGDLVRAKCTARDHRLDVLDMMHAWVASHPRDFAEPDGRAAGEAIGAFVASELEQHGLEADSPLYWALALVGEDLRKLPRPAPETRLTLAETTLTTCPLVRFSTMAAAEFALQLSLMEAEVLAAVRLGECLRTRWTKKDRATRAPTVVAAIDHFNQISALVTTVIVKAGPEARGRNLGKAIGLAAECVAMRNFGSARAVVAGLQSTPVYRLRRTWAQLPRETLAQYDELAAIFNEEANMAALRGAMDAHGAACLPYLGMYLSDLTYIDAALPSALSRPGNGDGDVGVLVLSIERRNKEADVLARVRGHQEWAAAYRTSKTPNILFQHWFAHYPTLNPDEAYFASLRIEPRAGGAGEGGAGPGPDAAVDTASILDQRQHTARLLTRFLAERPQSVERLCALMSRNARVLSAQEARELSCTIRVAREHGAAPEPMDVTVDDTAADVIRRCMGPGADDLRLVLIAPTGNAAVPADGSLVMWRDDLMTYSARARRHSTSAGAWADKADVDGAWDLFVVVREHAIVRVRDGAHGDGYKSLAVAHDTPAHRVVHDMLVKLDRNPDTAGMYTLWHPPTNTPLRPNEFVITYAQAAPDFYIQIS